MMMICTFGGAIIMYVCMMLHFELPHACIEIDNKITERVKILNIFEALKLKY